VVSGDDTSFPRRRRLLRPSQFSHVYDCRQSAAAGPIVLYAAANAADTAAVRLGLSVSRRIGNAVVRNRWKRRLRETFRTVRAALPAGNDFVIVVRSGPAPVGAEASGHLGDTLVALAARVVGRRGYAEARPVPREVAATKPKSKPKRRR
jgi:ribonuclease P protein component